mmetsp:Transcript_20247/g.34908  ORF Transcript_20247/g.34908 Transcript_20247/m.34908 type:complete len:205 (-) Transcript_20247:464-1078(-)
MGRVVHPSGERNALSRDTVDDRSKYSQSQVPVRVKVCGDEAGESHDVGWDHAKERGWERLVINFLLLKVLADSLGQRLVEPGIFRIDRMFKGNHGTNFELIEHLFRLIGKRVVGDEQIGCVSSAAQEEHLPTTWMGVQERCDVVHLASDGDPRALFRVVLCDLFPGVLASLFDFGCWLRLAAELPCHIGCKIDEVRRCLSEDCE